MKKLLLLFCFITIYCKAANSQCLKHLQQLMEQPLINQSHQQCKQPVMPMSSQQLPFLPQKMEPCCDNPNSPPIISNPPVSTQQLFFPVSPQQTQPCCNSPNSPPIIPEPPVQVQQLLVPFSQQEIRPCLNNPNSLPLIPNSCVSTKKLLMPFSPQEIQPCPDNHYSPPIIPEAPISVQQLLNHFSRRQKQPCPNNPNSSPIIPCPSVPIQQLLIPFSQQKIQPCPNNPNLPPIIPNAPVSTQNLLIPFSPQEIQPCPNNPNSPPIIPKVVPISTQEFLIPLPPEQTQLCPNIEYISSPVVCPKVPCASQIITPVQQQGSTIIITDSSPSACQNLAETLQLMIVCNMLQNNLGAKEISLEMATPVINELLASPVLSCGCPNPIFASGILPDLVYNSNFIPPCDSSCSCSSYVNYL